MVTHVQARPLSSPTLANAVAPVQAPWPGRVGRAVWEALHAIGAGRARKELARLAASTNDPQLAAHLRTVIREDWLTRG